MVIEEAECSLAGQVAFNDLLCLRNGRERVAAGGRCRAKAFDALSVVNVEDAIPLEDEVVITLLLFLLFRDVFLLDELAVDAEAGDFAVFAIEDAGIGSGRKDEKL